MRKHEHVPGQIKWNGGNVVYLCAVCRVIAWHAVFVGTVGGEREWVPGERYGVGDD